MQYVNYAVGDVRRRKGKLRFTSESYFDLAERLKGQFQAFSMWLSYGEDFITYVEANEWSVKGWIGEGLASFSMFPVDFDASGDLELAFTECRDFVQTELLDKGVDTRYFVIYLSGGKGFHVEISASVLNVEMPMEHAGFRLRSLVAEWQKVYPCLDLSVYNSTSLFRLPGSKHKSGLHKNEIAWEDFNLEHLDKRTTWAAYPQVNIRIPELGDPPLKLEVPEVVVTAGPTYSTEVDFDPDAMITPSCPWLQSILADPSAKGQDGKGRENRRNAVGILLSAHATSEHNVELQQYIQKLSEHDYMTKPRMDDAMKWVREYDKDGEIKCKKTCYAVGCSAPQRKTCGTRSPLDWKLKKRSLETISVEEARVFVEAALRRILTTEGNGIYVADFPVGIGKTFYMLQLVKELELTAFYIAQTHKLSWQSHLEFVGMGLQSRHVASRMYLAKTEEFECLMPLEVDMAISNGYGSHTICGTCPKKRKRQEGLDSLEPDSGFDPCEYWEQFENLKETEIVCGVHNHLFEFMYEAAAVDLRGVTVIDESPLEVLGKTVPPLNPDILGRVLTTMNAEIERLETMAMTEVKPALNVGKFARVAQLMEQDHAMSQSEEARQQIDRLSNFRNIFEGKLFNLGAFDQMKEEQQRAVWYEVATVIADRSGLSMEYNLPEDKHYLAVPYVLPTALALASRNIVYNPTSTHYLPGSLPPNKVLILDATASTDAYGPVMAHITARDPRPYTFVTVPLVEQPYSNVVQITSSSYGVSVMYDEETQVYIMSVIRQLILKHGGTSLIVCHKQHQEFWTRAFSKDPEVSIGTYGSLKGLNQWASCTSQFIVGTPFIPDEGIRDLSAKLGQDITLAKLSGSAALRKTLLLAKNGDTAVIARRFFQGHQFQSALAQMKSQWEVTQAVRLRLYNKPVVEKQHLYIFSNVDLKGMYADQYHTLSELAWELNKEAQAAEASSGRRKLELSSVAYEQLTEVFDSWPKDKVFVKNSFPPDFCGERYIQYWIQMAVNAGWAKKLEKQRKYIKII